MRRYAERQCRADADDATQEALIVVHRRLPSLRSAAAFPAWLFRIVARICAGLVSPLWRRIEKLKQEEAAPALDLDLRLDVDRAVEALPEAYKEAVMMHYFGDFSIAEIAARLGIGEGAAKVRLHRARARIRRHLETGAAA